MFGYIEDLLLFFLVIYIIKGVLKNIFPIFFKAPNPGNFRNQSGPFQNQNGGNPFTGYSQSTNSNPQPKPEGKIEVEYIPPPKEKKGKNFEGDFIDYEEIKK